jgi:hypothetical protein
VAASPIKFLLKSFVTVKFPHMSWAMAIPQ